MYACVCLYPLIVMEQSPKSGSSHAAGLHLFTDQTAQQYLHGFVWKKDTQIIRGDNQLIAMKLLKNKQH